MSRCHNGCFLLALTSLEPDIDTRRFKKVAALVKLNSIQVVVFDFLLIILENLLKDDCHFCPILQWHVKGNGQHPLLIHDPFIQKDFAA